MESASQWVKIFSSEQFYKIEIAKGVLEENGIPSVVLNKQSSSHVVVGFIELYVNKEYALKAVNLIKAIKYE